MFTTDNLPATFARFDDLKAKVPRPHDPNDSPVEYTSLNVVKKLSKAKFPVYLASSKVNKQNYAMKVFTYKGDKLHPYFKNEVRFASLKHRNIINVVHCENEKDTLQKGELKKVSYILMEYAPYGDFFDFVTKHRECFDDKLVRTYFRQLVDGIEYLHSSGVAHLDLKPENILMGADFNLKIADFDLSYVSGDTKVLSRGTKFYRGPEFFNAGSSDPEIKAPFAADVYGAGVILFILKSGGIYPHSETTPLEGIDLLDMLYNDNAEFWNKHCEIEDRPSSFYEKEFRDLFNNMVKSNPEERLSIKEIKKSSWYNGPVYTSAELQKKMKKILNL